MMSALLDAADLLVAAGVAAAVPTAAAGLNDWSDTAGPQTRVGLVHAALNTTALSLYLASLVARARGRRRRQGAGPSRTGGADRRRVPGRAPVLRHGRGCQPHRVAAAAGPVDAGAGRHRTGRRDAPQGRRRWRAGPVAPGPRERCTPWPARAVTWAARWRRERSATAASPARGTAAPSGLPTAASCAARPARQSPATRRPSITGVSRSALSHRRCGPQPSARVVTEDTVLRASNGPDRRGCSITERRIWCADRRSG